jgi:thioredoxin-related protein
LVYGKGRLPSVEVLHMSNLTKKIEVAANVTIIILAVVIIAVLAKKYLFESNIEPSAPKPIPVGAKIAIPEIEWQKNQQTLLLVMSDGCRFCAESAGFYKKVIQEAAQSNTSLIAVFPENADNTQNYLKSLDLPIKETRQISFEAINVQGTPTLIFVDSKGVVTNSWVGKLPPALEEEVLNKVKCSTCN